jgi:hypothetical protein
MTQNSEHPTDYLDRICTFISLSVAPPDLDMGVFCDNSGDLEWNREVGMKFADSITSKIDEMAKKFEDLTNRFYYFYYDDSATPIGYLLSSNNQLGTLLDKGSNFELDDGEPLFLSYSSVDIATELRRIMQLDEKPFLQSEMSIRLVRSIGYPEDEIGVEIEYLADFMEIDPDDGDEYSKLLNDLTRDLDPDLGNDVEAYVGNGSIVRYQCWEDGSYDGAEGCLDDPGGDSWEFELNRDALIELFGNAKE